MELAPRLDVMHIDQRSRTGFFDLPPELRNDIYSLVASNDHARGTSRKFIVAACTEIPALAKSCRQMRSEYLAFWMEGKTLEFHLNLPRREPEVEKDLQHWMATIGSAIVPYCKDFRIGEVRVTFDAENFVMDTHANQYVVAVPRLWQVWQSRLLVDDHQGWRERRMADELVRVLKERGEKVYFTAEDIERARALYGARKVVGWNGRLVGWVP